MTREFTGRHLAYIMIAFFAVIIAVNATMATIAGTSWTGFVVRNSYVASQEFNDKVAAAREQAALGWEGVLDISDGRISATLVDAAGRPVDLESARLVLRNPATDRDDRSIALAARGTAFTAPWAARDGLWIAELVVTARDGTPWHETRRIVLEEGRLK